MDVREKMRLLILPAGIFPLWRSKNFRVSPLLLGALLGGSLFLLSSCSTKAGRNPPDLSSPSTNQSTDIENASRELAECLQKHPENNGSELCAAENKVYIAHFLGTGQGDSFLSNIKPILKPGTIVFDVPAEMDQGEDRTVQVRIARSVNAQMKAQMLKDMGSAPQTATINVAEYMTATLKSSDQAVFSVQSLTKDEQLVLDSDFTTWEWNVQPLKSGEQHLFLDVGVRFKIVGSPDETRFLPTFQRVINVRVNRLFAMRHFLSEEWKWLLGAIGSVAVFLFGLNWKKNKAAEQKP
jgi:hypothetical protein